MKKHLITAAALALSTLAVRSTLAVSGTYNANTGVWTEMTSASTFGSSFAGATEYYWTGSTFGFNEFDGAGRVLSTASVTAGATPGQTLNAINPTLWLNYDADLYKIYIGNPASFSASLPSANTNSTLVLFDANGNALSGVVGGASPILGAPAVGLYYLGIGAFNSNALPTSTYDIPQNASGQPLFNAPGGPGALTLANPSGGDTLATTDIVAWPNFNPNWNTPESGSPTNLGLLDNTSFAQGSTTISLIGAGTVPEPASLTLLGLGAAGLIARRRRTA